MVVVAAAMVGGRLLAEQPQRRQQPEQAHDHPPGQQPGGQPGPDVVEHLPAPPQPGGRRPQDHQQQAAGLLVGHRNTTWPTSSAQQTATAKVRGANRAANRRPNMPDCMAISFTSTAGPTTRKTSRAVSENSRRLAATNASASEQMANSTASPPRASTDSAGWSATASSSDRGTKTCNVAAAAAPTTSHPPASQRSWRAAELKASQRDPSPVAATRPRARSTQASPPTRHQTSPTAMEVPSEPRKRAATILGCPGKATAVATRTTGFTAGAASMNVSAAAGWTPRAHSRPAIGTEAHSHP